MVVGVWTDPNPPAQKENPVQSRSSGAASRNAALSYKRKRERVAKSHDTSRHTTLIIKKYRIEVNSSTLRQPLPAKNETSHPPGLYLLFFVELWERFSYYGMRAILTLYMVAALVMPAGQEGIAGLGFSKAEAGQVMGWFQGFVYLMPILGGYVADNYIGRRLSISLGGLMMMTGHLCLAAQAGLPMFFLGLVLLCLGNGFFKPNISTIVGELYKEGDARRDAAFTIFYMGINIGALAAPIVCGWFRSEASGYMGYRYGFLTAAAGMLLGLILYWLMGDKYLGDLSKKPAGKARKSDAADPSAAAKPLTKIETDRIVVIVVLSLFVTAFWAGFDLAPTAMTFFTDNLIDRKLTDSLTIETSWFQSINPIFVVVLAPVFAALWVSLARRKREPSTPVKMAIGIVLAGVGFLFMYAAALQVGDPNIGKLIDGKEYELPASVPKAAMSWVILAYLFHTLGELCLSPVGLSMVTKLAPAKYASMLMGVWFFSVFLANIIAGYLVAVVDKVGYQMFFLYISLVIIGLGLILGIFAKKLRAMMHGAS
jgi:POT family proton-dependent oligopeptide transporter